MAKPAAAPIFKRLAQGRDQEGTFSRAAFGQEELPLIQESKRTYASIGLAKMFAQETHTNVLANPILSCLKNKTKTQKAQFKEI